MARPQGAQQGQQQQQGQQGQIVRTSTGQLLQVVAKSPGVAWLFFCWYFCLSLELFLVEVALVLVVEVAALVLVLWLVGGFPPSESYL